MHKKIGETPLQCLDRLRVEKPEFANVSLTYAGRLDPMAEGVLLVLAGEECKQRERFLSLDKEYVCEILWGFSTDTYDILGKIADGQKMRYEAEISEIVKKLSDVLPHFLGKQQQQFPPFSSKPINGKPLHKWAREDRLSEIEMPSKEIEIKDLKTLNTESVSGAKIEQIILERISLVKGDFRQQEIISKWKEAFKNNTVDKYFISKINIYCTSGTYIRGLVHEIGRKLGIETVVFGLKRTKVGDYT